MADPEGGDHGTAWGVTLFVAVLIAAVVLVLAFFIRARVNHSRDRQICNRVNTLYDVLEREHEQKYRRTEKFLLNHPEGVDGISREDILNSLKDERNILNDLSARCVT